MGRLMVLLMACSLAKTAFPLTSACFSVSIIGRVSLPLTNLLWPFSSDTVQCRVSTTPFSNTLYRIDYELASHTGPDVGINLCNNARVSIHCSTHEQCFIVLVLPCLPTEVFLPSSLNEAPLIIEMISKCLLCYFASNVQALKISYNIFLSTCVK